MAYVTLAEFGGDLGYLTQLDITEDFTKETAVKVLNRATAIVDRVLGFSFAGYDPETGTPEDAYTSGTVRKVKAGVGPYFRLPSHEIGTVTAVFDAQSVEIDEWEELETGTLYAVDSSGYEGNWNRGIYSVTANWGYGLVPLDVAEVALELAVNIWRSKDSGRFSNVVGVEAGGSGAVGYESALTPTQKMILKTVINQKRISYPGIVV